MPKPPTGWITTPQRAPLPSADQMKYVRFENSLAGYATVENVFPEYEKGVDMGSAYWLTMLHTQGIESTSLLRQNSRQTPHLQSVAGMTHNGTTEKQSSYFETDGLPGVEGNTTYISRVVTKALNGDPDTLQVRGLYKDYNTLEEQGKLQFSHSAELLDVKFSARRKLVLRYRSLLSYMAEHHHFKREEQQFIRYGIIAGFTIAKQGSPLRYMHFTPRISGFDPLNLEGQQFPLKPNSLMIMVLGKFQKYYSHGVAPLSTEGSQLIDDDDRLVIIDQF